MAEQAPRCTAAAWLLAALFPCVASAAGFDQVQRVIDERCTVCHSAHPTSSLFGSAPAGIIFDTPQQIQLMAPRIQAQAVDSEIMPLGNLTNMTAQERQLLKDWIAAGAKAD